MVIVPYLASVKTSMVADFIVCGRLLIAHLAATNATRAKSLL
jgi:hypothetical protein